MHHKHIELNNSNYINIKVAFQQRAGNVFVLITNIYTRKIKVSVAFHSEIIAQIATVGSTRSPP